MSVEFLPNSFYRPGDADLRSIGTEGTLAQWRHHGTGPAFHKLNNGRGSRVLYHGKDLLSWLEKKRVEAESEAA